MQAHVLTGVMTADWNYQTQFDTWPARRALSGLRAEIANWGAPCTPSTSLVLASLVAGPLDGFTQGDTTRVVRRVFVFLCDCHSLLHLHHPRNRHELARCDVAMQATLVIASKYRLTCSLSEQLYQTQWERGMELMIAVGPVLRWIVGSWLVHHKARRDKVLPLMQSYRGALPSGNRVPHHDMPLRQLVQLQFPFRSKPNSRCWQI